MWSLKFYKAHNQGFICHTCETQTYKASLTLIDQRKKEELSKLTEWSESFSLSQCQVCHLISVVKLRPSDRSAFVIQVCFGTNVGSYFFFPAYDFADTWSPPWPWALLDNIHSRPSVSQAVALRGAVGRWLLRLSWLQG